MTKNMTTDEIEKMRNEEDKTVNLELKIFESLIWGNFGWAGMIFKQMNIEKQDLLISDLEKSVKWLKSVQHFHNMNKNNK